MKKVKTKTKAKSIDQKAFGDEPIIVGEATNAQLTDCFNYYNYFFDASQAKRWLLEYLKRSKWSVKTISEIRSAPDWRTVTSTGWMSRMMMNGTTFSQEYMERFQERVELNARYGIKEKPKTDVKVVSIQDRVKKVIYRLITDAEEQFDLNPEFDMYEFLVKSNATQQAATAVRDFYMPALIEIRDGGDDIKEAYGKKQKYWYSIYQKIIDNCDRFIGNKKTVKIRKPREKKTKSAVDLVKNLKYQKEFPPLKIVSVNPAEIIGCNQLWVYNTKYKKLTQYISMSPQGLQIKGTTLIGWDLEQSVSKGLRKPDITVGELLKAGKVSLRSFMTDLKTVESKPNGRINVDTILLRVIK